MRISTLFSALVTVLSLSTTTVVAASIVKARGRFDLQARQADNSRQQTDDDIKNLCTDKGGVALWRPKRGGPLGEARLSSPGEVQPWDVGSTQGATYNWMYAARLAMIRSMSNNESFDVKSMFKMNGNSATESGWCLLPDNVSVTVSIGGNHSTTYEGQAYKDLLAELSNLSVVGDRPTHWVYLLGKALKTLVYIDKPEGDFELSDVVPDLVRYCSILTGKECASVAGQGGQGHDTEKYIVQGAETGHQPAILVLTDEDDKDYDRGVFSVERVSYASGNRLQMVTMWDPETASETSSFWPLHDFANNIDKAATVVYVKQ